MEQKLGRDLTVGSIPKHLLVFSIPTLIGNLLQTGYSIINTIWIGNIVGEDGIGATTVTTSVIFVIIALAIGLTTATTILVSQYYGAKNYEKVKLTVNNSFIVALIIGAVMTIGGILFRETILRFMNTPEEIFQSASGYLKITLTGLILYFLSALIIAILRGVGDSFTPLIFTAIGVTINAVLDPMLILGIGPFPELGLNGAAYASIIAQGIAFMFSLYYLNHKENFISLDYKRLLFDKEVTLKICKLGLPFAVQSAFVSIGGLFINTFVNAFGASAINAYGAASRIDQIAFMPGQSIGAAVATLTGQNLGANKPERIKLIFKWSIIFTTVFTLAVSACAVSLPGHILSIFGFDSGSQGFDIGIEYLRIVGSSYVFLCVMFAIGGIFNGSGLTTVSMALALLSLWVVRLPLAAVLSKTSLGLKGIWLSIGISFFVVMSVALIYYYSGRWKKAAYKVIKSVS
ncbi:putative MATE family efflux protein [Anaerobacterium chartisolvens]|uniref:Probable multidrug resistance protein NorM n=1 Tax=Anaerobacterium chartisolvens TaxID=1297424 RepID=A0A369B3F3_9FIRM|nr:MATE family efflux transporter [Anaerobacterium chartisolvens]RCX16059.1 putative MATE family efflux protein [Anaerobacterium chartisolvens]